MHSHLNVQKEKDLSLLPGIHPQFRGRKALNLGTTPTALSRLLQHSLTWVFLPFVHVLF